MGGWTKGEVGGRSSRKGCLSRVTDLDDFSGGSYGRGHWQSSVIDIIQI